MKEDTLGAPVVVIYDPPMCCASGLCGPAIDPALLDMNEAILRLKSECGATVYRYLLSQSGAKFAENPEVLTRLQTWGIEILPITTINGTVVKERGYPKYEELRALIAQFVGGSHADVRV